MKNTYLNPNVINQIDNLYLKAKMIVEGYMSGLHKSPYHGFSIEFSEHRAYGIGDEVKNIDFDDSFIYSEINKKIEDRKIQMIQMHRDEALKAFKIWDEKVDKIKY